MMSSVRMRRIVPALAAFVFAAPAFAAPASSGSSVRGPGCEHCSGPGGEHRRGPGGPGPMFDPERMEEFLDERADRIADLLDLTADQRAAFDAARTEALDAARPKMDRMRQLGDELRRMLDDGSTDAAQVGARVIEMHQLKGELRDARQSVESELSKLLTDEQRFAFDALKEARRDGRGPHGFERGHGFGHRPGR